MKMDILNFGAEETAVRFTLGYAEATLLMDACAALRDARFPGVMEKLPRMFDEEDLARVLGNEEQVNDLMAIFECEQAFHQALHMFPGGHSHEHDEE
jgi:hypothetical protein